jgi:hypothetical protein
MTPADLSDTSRQAPRRFRRSGWGEFCALFDEPRKPAERTGPHPPAHVRDPRETQGQLRNATIDIVREDIA